MADVQCAIDELHVGFYADGADRERRVERHGPPVVVVTVKRFGHYSLGQGGRIRVERVLVGLGKDGLESSRDRNAGLSRRGRSEGHGRIGTWQLARLCPAGPRRKRGCRRALSGFTGDCCRAHFRVDRMDAALFLPHDVTTPKDIRLLESDYPGQWPDPRGSLVL